MDSTKKKIIKSKVKKPKVKKTKVKKPKTTQKQKQTQTTKVTVNVGDMKKKTTTRRKQPAGRRPMLSNFSSPYVHPPIIIQGSQQQQPLITLLDLERRETKLKDGIKEGFKTLARRIDESTGNLAIQENEPVEIVKNDFDEERRRREEQPAGTAEEDRDASTSSSVVPETETIAEADVIEISKRAKTTAINKKLKDYQDANEGNLPSLSVAKGFSRNVEFQALNISKANIEEAYKNYKKKQEPKKQEPEIQQKQKKGRKKKK